MDFTKDVERKPIKASNYDETNFGKGVLLSISTNGEPDYDFSKHKHPSDIIFIMQCTWSYSALLFHIWQKEKKEEKKCFSLQYRLKRTLKLP